MAAGAVCPGAGAGRVDSDPAGKQGVTAKKPAFQPVEGSQGKAIAFQHVGDLLFLRVLNMPKVVL